jgi:polyisoprenoid-binding protein YceI
MLYAVILSLSALLSSGEGTQAKYKVDAKASKVEWVGKKVTGQHSGVVNLKEGSLLVEDGKLKGGSFVIDMASLEVLDLGGESKGKLEGHLKSDDFFGTEKFSTSNFTITKVIPQGTAKYKVVGNITIKGITQEIQFPAELKAVDGKLVGTANIVIDRTKFNIKYGSGSFFDDLGDKTIYDDFELTVNIVAEK